MTKLQAIRAFTNSVLGEKIIIAKEKFEDNNFAMGIFDEVPRLKLPKNLNFKYDKIDKSFRRNFVERCPLARGFSSVTLTLLHECGHWATRSIMNIVEYSKMREDAYTQEQYMQIPWEHLATEWAICWLYSPENRRLAKVFEQFYFGHRKE